MARFCRECDRVVPESHFYPNSTIGRCRGKIKWPQARRFQLMTLVDAGKSNRQIATALGTTEVAVELARKRYGITSVYNHALSGHDVRRLMGLRCVKTVTRWIDMGLLPAKRARKMGRHPNWLITMNDLYGFLEDERTWHLWEPERITDDKLRRHAIEVRGGVRFLTPAEVAERLCVQPGTVGQWVRKGWLPARRWGAWRIDERDIARFELPQIGGAARRKDAA